MKRIFVILGVVILSECATVINEDKPCAAKQFDGTSVVCVCNATYCDELTKIAPGEDEFILYLSSKAGSRFKKSVGKVELNSEVSEPHGLSLSLDPCKKYQKINGFGSSVSDAAAINYISLPEAQRQFFINSYFGEKGLGYSILRVPIAGSDFSTHKYSYNELPIDDVNLTNYSLTEEDHLYKIPLIKAALSASSTPIHLIAATWTAPKWMLEPLKFLPCGRLNTSYLHTYALYQLKFLELYDAHNITFWALSTSNEPSNGLLPLDTFNCLGWSASILGNYLANHLGPMIRDSKYKSLKILALDDQRYHIPLWFNEILEWYPHAIDYIDALGLHWYGNSYTPPEILEFITLKYPHIIMLATEACEGAMPWDRKRVDLGSWERAETYTTDILFDLNYNVTGWLDWNMCVDDLGGPTWNKNYVDASSVVSKDKGEFYKQPIYYSMGHFAKFVTRGSYRIHVEEDGSVISANVKYAAFITTNDTIVVVIHNNGPAKNIKIRVGNRQVDVELEDSSIASVEFQSTPGSQCEYKPPQNRNK